jgi:hypothetical protein
MKTIKINNSKIIKQTNYAPLFAFKSLVKFLESNGCECYIKNKARNTNSYYIEFDGNGVSGEIRISDHSKKIESKNEEIEYAEVTKFTNSYNFCSDIVTKEGYQKAKEVLSNLITKN